MLTRRRHEVRALLIAAMALLALGYMAISAIAGDAVGPVDSVKYGVPNTVEDQLKDVVSFGKPPLEAISSEAALEIASAEYGKVVDGASSREQYVATITIGAANRVADPIRDRAVWIVRFGGLHDLADPPLRDMAKDEVRIYETLYVLLDANTGEFLFGAWPT